MPEHGIKTLVVDDSNLFCAAIKSYLEAQKDIDLIGLVDSGEKCLKFVNKHSLDLIIMDVRMSGMDGSETTRELKKNHPNLQVMICTVWAEQEARKYVIQSGADDYFVKGTSLSVLLRKIKSLFPSCRQLHIFQNPQ